MKFYYFVSLYSGGKVPVNVMVDTEIHSATIHWSTLYTSELTHYVVEYWNTGSSSHFTAETLTIDTSDVNITYSVELRDLEAGTTYCFVVKAVTDPDNDIHTLEQYFNTKRKGMYKEYTHQ